jgi:6-oxo-cyclohex-1-ene-carbonyl-CoA hydrolase
MALDFLMRDNKLKDHNLFGDEHFGTEPPCTIFEKNPSWIPKEMRWRGYSPPGLH